MEITFNLSVHAEQFYNYVSDRYKSTELHRKDCTVTATIVKNVDQIKYDLHELAEYFAGPWNYEVTEI